MNLLKKVYEARNRIKGVAVHTPLMKNDNLSEEFSAQVYLKREDLQPVRSYKLRGAYNKIVSLSEEEKSKGRRMCECRKSRTRGGVCVQKTQY